MSEEKTPGAVDAKPTPAPEDKPTDRYKELTAAAEKIAKSADDFGTKVEHLTKLQQDLAAEREKMREIKTGDAPPGLTFKSLMERPTKDPEIKELHELNDRAVNRAIVRAGKAGLLPESSGWRGTPVNLSKHIPAEIWDGIDEVKEIRFLAQKAAGSWWDATTATSVAEWAPTSVLTAAIEYPAIDSNLPSLFPNFTIPRGVRTLDVPVETTQAHAFYEAEKTAKGDEASLLNTNLVSTGINNTASLTGKKITNIAGMDMVVNEDVAVDMLSWARSRGARTVMQGRNQVIINAQGDDDADLDDAPGTSGYHVADDWSNDAGDNGLRLHCIINSFTTAIGGAVTSDDLLAARKSMGLHGARPMDLAYITSPKGYLGMLADDDVKTVDKYGPGATVLTGELAKSGGIAIFMDSEFSEDLDAAGINANAATTGITGGVLVNRNRWFWGQARSMEQTIVPQPGFDNVYVVTRARNDFVIAVTDEHNAHYLINVL